MLYYIASIILFVFSFLQSSHSLPWSAAHSEIFVFFALAFFGLGSIKNKKIITLHTTIFTKILALLIFITWIQFFIGKIYFFGDAFIFSIYLFSCVISLFLIQIHGSDRRWILFFAFTLLGISLASSFISIIQALGTHTDANWIFQSGSFRRPGANIAQPNHIGTILIMGFASLIYIDQRLLLHRVLTTLCGFVLFIGLGITESRTSIISCTLFFLWWFYIEKISPRAPSPKKIAASVLTLFTVMWIWPQAISSFHEGGKLEKQVLINTTSSMRLETWSNIWQAAWDHPWFGWGMRGTSEALSTIRHDHIRTQPFTYAHNFILELIISIGFPLTIIICSAIVFSFYKWIKNIKTIDEWYAIGILTPFALHNLFEYPFAYAYLLIPAFIAIGVLERNYGNNSTFTIKKNTATAILTIFLAIIFKLSADYISIEDDYRIARFRASNIEVSPITNQHSKINPIILTQIEALVFATTHTPTENMSKAEIEKLRQTAIRFPWPQIQNKYAFSLALNNNPQEADRQLKIIHAMHGQQRFDTIRQQWIELRNTKYEILKSISIIDK